MRHPSEILKSVFGYDEFRPHQLEAIERTLSGQDSIVIMPTGGGKSVCYQIPAQIFDHLTIVVSPLISLMKDQVDSLQANGVSCAFFNSSLGDVDKRTIIEQCTQNKIDLLYVSPETFVHAFDQWIGELQISFVAIDEAHCVSSWGHDFRPEYRLIKEVRQRCQGIPFMALTATADKVTRQDISKQLGLTNPELYLSSFNRSNLSLSVQAQIPKKKKRAEIVDFLSSRSDESGILYCLSRKECEEWSAFLNESGLNSRFYHAGMGPEQREIVQDGFINDDFQVICATIAFGMGIDKPNVRWVIHNNLPKNIEGYYQEIGRAGRDGLPSDTILYYNYRDVVLLNDFIKDSPNHAVYQEKIKRMLQYAEASSCRRNVLLSYFGEHKDVPCNNCDVCENPPELIEGTVLAQKALSAILRTGQAVGINNLINVLRGGKTSDIFANNWHLIKTYGAGADHSFREWQHYVNQFINLGLIEIAYDDHLKLKVSEESKAVLQGEQTVQLSEYVDKKVAKKEKSSPSTTSVDNALSKELKAFRKELAAKNRVPAYVIFNDATLKDLTQKLPKSLPELYDIHGLGETKIKRFGEELLQLIKSSAVSDSENLNTYQKTLEMYKAGRSTKEIAELRELNEQTVINHLLKLHLQGEAVDLHQFITSYELNMVKEARLQHNGTQQLRPVFDSLEGAVDYSKISIAFAILDKTND